jgi:hypothetical protein
MINTEKLIALWENRPLRSIDLDDIDDRAFAVALILALKAAVPEIVDRSGITLHSRVDASGDVGEPENRLTDQPPWECHNCKQTNAGWAFKCGRCDEPRATTQSPSQADDEIPSNADASSLKVESNTHTQAESQNMADIAAGSDQTDGNSSIVSSSNERLASARKAGAASKPPSAPKRQRRRTKVGSSTLP